jgi:ABC-type proline/glycine betaine transport system permease subunit
LGGQGFRFLTADKTSLTSFRQSSRASSEKAAAMTGNGEFLRTTLIMSLGVIVGGLAVAEVLSLKTNVDLSLAGLASRIGPNGLPDPLVTGAIGTSTTGRPVILDPCTGLRKN